ncbi:MAG: tyrosine-type recombinase/integrase [Candidatus Eisenbacteria sp.]|nr:tyrosine-type recombinase/integrase [Candidatus Eisenbacteria bacterium]
MTAHRSHLSTVIADYLALKQALGRQFFHERRVLTNLEHFLAPRTPGGPSITPDAFAAWCLTFTHLCPTSRRNRMRIVRNLCLYIRRTEPSYYVPDPATFPTPQAPRRPYIFSKADIVRILRTADGLPPRSTSPLRGPMMRLAVVLLYTAGLRRGELVRLVLSDYDPIESTLLIRRSKFHKSRLVALSPGAVRELEAYLLVRRRLPHEADAPLLVCRRRGLRARSGAGLGQSLRRLFQDAGVRTARGGAPRVHDLRHTHAVHVLLRWYRAGMDVQAKLPALATSMGHVSIVSTAYYLAMLSPVVEAANERFARHCAALFTQPSSEGGEE